MCVRIDIEQGHLLRWSDLIGAWVADESWDRNSKFPGSLAPIVVATKKREIFGAQWGLTPARMKDSKWGIKNAVNARSETIFEKPTWQAAVRQRRCIVPVTAFYEQRDRRWARFTAAEGVLAIAGLFEDPNDYCHLRSFALITTTPNEQVSPYQDRMPVVLANEDIGMWLDPSTPVNAMKALFKPCPIFWTSVEDAGPTTRPKFVTALKEPSLFEE